MNLVLDNNSLSWLVPAALAVVGLFAGAIVVIGGMMWIGAKLYVNNSALKKECKAANKNYEAEKCRAEKINNELEKLQELTVDGSFVFAHSDPRPQFPLCPVCLADGKNIRMIRAGVINPVTVNAINQFQSLGIQRDPETVLNANRKGFCCPKCGTHIFVHNSDLDSLEEKYGIVFP